MPDWFHNYDEKRPDQIQHRLGKSWLYTAINIRTMPGSEEKLIYYKSEDKQFEQSFGIRPDAYCKTIHAKWGTRHTFAEFQISSSIGDWGKKYPALFKSLAGDQAITLMVVTADDYSSLKKHLIREMSGMKNITLAFYTLDDT